MLRSAGAAAGVHTARARPASRGVTLGFVEFFAGSGLVAQGMKGLMRPLWANDISSKKASVYAANHGSRHLEVGSITEVSGAQLPAADLAWASFPCQDLSLAGLAKGIHAPRSGLVWEWLRVIDEMRVRPPILAAENVAGLVSSAGGENYRALHRALASRGYRAGAVLLDACRWLPQSRPRVFVVAVDRGHPIPPSLVADGPTWMQPGPVARAGGSLDAWVWWKLPEPGVRKATLSDLIEWDAPVFDADVRKRYLAMLSPAHAERLAALPRRGRFALPGYVRTRNGRPVLELRFDGVAGCLRTPGGGSSRQLVVLRSGGVDRIRLLTARETARLMGAPDHYALPGSYNDGYKAMGDAVAVPVVRWLARELFRPLLSSAAR